MLNVNLKKPYQKIFQDKHTKKNCPNHNFKIKGNFPKKLKGFLKKNFAFKNLGQKSILAISAGAICLVAATLFFLFFFNDKIVPNVFVANINLSGKTKREAQEYLKTKISTPKNLSLFAKNQELKLALDEIDFSYDFPTTCSNAYKVYRQNKFPFYSSGIFTSFKNKKQIGLTIEFNQEKLNEYILVISNQLSSFPVNPSVELKNGEIVVEKGKEGKIVSSSKLENQIIDNLKNADFSPILIPFTKSDPKISDTQANDLKKRLSKLIGKKIDLEYDNSVLVLSDEEIIPAFSSLDSSSNFYKNNNFVNLIEKVKSGVEREPQNAVFRFEGGKVLEFVPAREGLTIEEEGLMDNLKTAFSELENTDQSFVKITVPTISKSPEITTESINNLGIEKLIGKGSSSFRGSMWERAYNIGLASSKFNGALIAPNETFSFNKVLGDISKYTGYKQAYIIKDGKTILGDGGGVCQVSTTMFRAALDAGLPIIERRAHSYRVSYYEQDSAPGIDATVYDPTTDFKFKNDTPGHILIQTVYDEKAKTLVFEFYGTDDRRVATITKPQVYDVSPPPEDLYIDDPTLPAGQIKQIDYKAWGAKAKVDYTVTRKGETIYEKTFYSNYQPWQAKFLRGVANP